MEDVRLLLLVSQEETRFLRLQKDVYEDRNTMSNSLIYTPTHWLQRIFMHHYSVFNVIYFFLFLLILKWFAYCKSNGPMVKVPACSISLYQRQTWNTSRLIGAVPSKNFFNKSLLPDQETVLDQEFVENMPSKGILEFDYVSTSRPNSQVHAASSVAEQVEYEENDNLEEYSDYDSV